jgi:hypothetical protein
MDRLETLFEASAALREEATGFINTKLRRPHEIEVESETPEMVALTSALCPFKAEDYRPEIVKMVRRYLKLQKEVFEASVSNPREPVTSLLRMQITTVSLGLPLGWNLTQCDAMARGLSLTARKRAKSEGTTLAEARQALVREAWQLFGQWSEWEFHYYGKWLQPDWVLYTDFHQHRSHVMFCENGKVNQPVAAGTAQSLYSDGFCGYYDPKHAPRGHRIALVSWKGNPQDLPHPLRKRG